MAIEVKQMIIKSTIVSGRKDQDERRPDALDIESLREEMMEECRELIEQSLNELQER